MKKYSYLTPMLVIASILMILTGCKKPPVQPLTIGSVHDIDGNGYDTVRIGAQTWLVQNLKTVHYRNGDPVQFTGATDVWDGLTTGAYCDYNNDPANGAAYGHLYNYPAITDPRNICPVGWRIPTTNDWMALTTYLGNGNYLNGGTIVGGKIKEAGTAHWQAPNTGADNSTGFTALPGGARLSRNIFTGINQYALFGAQNTSISDFELDYKSAAGSGAINGVPNIGMSIRCIKQ